jgi:hypothetical protein
MQHQIQSPQAVFGIARLGEATAGTTHTDDRVGKTRKELILEFVPVERLDDS